MQRTQLLRSVHPLMPRFVRGSASVMGSTLDKWLLTRMRVSTRPAERRGRGGKEEVDMRDTSVPCDMLRVTTCDTDETLAAASGLFNQYRHSYGEQPDQDERTLGWLTDMVESNMLTVYTASLDSPADTPPIGLATCHAIPASLMMGRFWQLRDLYVIPESRRRGAAAALVSAAREAALEAGATRLSLVTETDNQAALGLYLRLGFLPVEGLASLSLELPLQATME